MNMFKKNGGFTLVELIVVIAILAILAGVAVPAYSGYIAKAEQASALQTLSAVNTAAQGLAVGENLKVTKIEVTNAGAITVYTAAADAAAGTAGTATFAERYSACSVEVTSLGGEGGGNIGMATTVTYGGTRSVGTASVSNGSVTFAVGA